MDRSTQPTMKDVARVAGVALGTVSRVFNGFPVGEEYRRRVEAAAEALGYQVNNYARGLKTNKTRCVALLMPSLKHPYFANLTDELTACLMSRGYYVHLMITNFDPEAEKKSFTLVKQNKVDGVIALTYRRDFAIQEDFPIVAVDCHLGEQVPCVSSDNFQGGQLAAEMLLERGCRKVLFLRMGPAIRGEPDRRGDGFEEVCRRTGTDYEMLIVNDEQTERPIFAFLDEHIRDGALDFDGIFCNTDGLARRVCIFLSECGVSVPEAVQVIGFDGIRDFADGQLVCSTIVQPVHDLAQKAVELLLEREAGEERSGVYRLPVAYAPGGTTKEAAPPPRFRDLPHPFDPFR